MAQKNRYLFRGRMSERKFRDLLRLFALDITADRAADLTGLHHNTTLALYRFLRLRMAEMAREEIGPVGGVAAIIAVLSIMVILLAVLALAVASAVLVWS